MASPATATIQQASIDLDTWARHIDLLKAYDQRALLKVCVDRIAWLDSWAWWLMLLAGIAAVVAIGRELSSKKGDPIDAKGIAAGGAILNAITGLMNALGGLEKVWIGLFGAALALSWTASSLSDGTCGNGAIDKAATKAQASVPTPAPAPKPT
jgi:hypothetical protein